MLRLRLTVAFHFPLSQMLPFSGGRLHVRAVVASRLHLSQWGDRRSLGGSLSSLSGTDSRTSIKVEFFFCTTAVGVVKIPREDIFFSFSAFVSTLCCPVIRRFRGIFADHRGFPGFHVKRFSVQCRFFGLVSYSARCMCAVGETCWCLWCSSVLALQGCQPLRLWHKVSWIYCCQFLKSISFIVFLGPNVQYWWLEMCVVTGKEGLQMWLEHHSSLKMIVISCWIRPSIVHRWLLLLEQ